MIDSSETVEVGGDGDECSSVVVPDETDRKVGSVYGKSISCYSNHIQFDY